MKGTPNEFFSLLSEEERPDAMQTFALIRRCDDSLRFEGLIGSWLISRLIGILRLDSAAIIMNPTPAAAATGSTQDVKSSTDLNKGASSINTDHDLTNSNSNSNSNNNNNNNSSSTTEKKETDVGGKSKWTFSTDKPLFMYVGHLARSGAAMNGFATHLAAMIASFSTTEGTSTTVASTISYCLHLLEHSKHKARLLNGLCSIIIFSHPSMEGGNDRGLTIPEKANVDLKRILTTALCCILLQVKTSCEAVQDFDYIWEACRDKASLVSNVFQDNQLSKECAWLLSVSAYLSDDTLSKGLTHAERRQVRLIISGACITLVARSSLRLARSCDENISSANNSETAALFSSILDAVNDLSQPGKLIARVVLLKEIQRVVLVAEKLELLKNNDFNNLSCSLDSSLPIQSLFSTHHGRVSSLAVLCKNCRELLNSTQNSYSPTGPSIFTGFNFVDETLLGAQNTTYIRIYLIDFSERKSTSSAGHVAAEVQFYKNIGEQTEAPDSEDIASQEVFLDSQHNAALQSEMADTLELNKWTSMLLEFSRKRIKPSVKVLFYIGSSNANKSFSANQNSVGKVMIPSLNQALERLSQAKKLSNEILKVDETGGMKATFQNNTSSKIKIDAETIGRAMILLYYSSIESILDYETARLKTTSHRNLLLSATFHKAVLSLCLVCVVHATSGNSSSFENDSYTKNAHLFVQSILTLMDCTAYEYMKVTESFSYCMENSAKSTYNKICQLPRLLKLQLEETEEKILESLLWKENSCMESMRTNFRVIGQLISEKDPKKLSWSPRVLQDSPDEDITTKEIVTATSRYLVQEDDPSSESQYIDYLVIKIMSLVSKRLTKLCRKLCLSPDNMLFKQIWYAFTEFMKERIHLVYDRHIDQIILCTIYGVGKAIKISPEITFVKIIQVYKSIFHERLGKCDADKIVQNVFLGTNTQGSIIDFYNQVYLPSMKTILRKIKNLGEEKNDNKRSCKETEAPDSIVVINKKSRTTIQLQDGNFELNLVHEDAKPENSSPRSRVLYSFGDPGSLKNLDLVNKAVNC